MNIWFFILLILAFAIILGPISMLRPSPGQKRKEQLRLHARSQNTYFSMRRLPALKTDVEQPPVMPFYYLPPPPKSRIRPEWTLMRTSYVHEGNFYMEWDWQNATRPSDEICHLLKNYLPQLPASVPAISSDNQGVGIFWQEREGKEMLDLLMELLTKLHQAENQPQN